jgi:glycosyltransferase involved in cell wall biosynthesis
VAEAGDAPTRITIILPLKGGRADYVRAAIASVLEQSSPRWALLIVVEPRELESTRLSFEASLADPRVRIITNEGRRLAGAINTGMRAADTDFVGLLLGDDLWEPGAVETLEWYIDAMPSVDFFHTGRQLIDDAGEPISTPHLARREIALADFDLATPVKHLLCWRRDMGIAVGGLDERSRSVGPDDFDFPWTMAEHGALFCAVDACLYLYRDHRSSERLTTHIPLSVHVRELRRILRKHGLDRHASERRIDEARVTYLRQCLYRSRPERWLRRLARRPPRRVWRDTYR